MEKTLIILKPDCIKSSLSGIIINSFQNKGYKMIACKMVFLTKKLLQEHYEHLLDQPFFVNIETFMRSCPVLVLVFEGKNVIKGIRDLLGPTDSKKALKGTIRGDFGTDKMLNIAHASDNRKNANIEIERFFTKDEIFQY